MKEVEGKGMKGKLKKITVMMIALAMFIMNLAGNVSYAYAAEATSLMLSETMDASALTITPGEVKHMRVPVRSNAAMLSSIGVRWCTLYVVTGEADQSGSDTDINTL
ncbi:MAG: hypothetical protein H6Q59_402 [Firmicutes bacterium]|nr:hypothetical protein [Bacillota bacterium]